MFLDTHTNTHTQKHMPQSKGPNLVDSAYRIALGLPHRKPPPPVPPPTPASTGPAARVPTSPRGALLAGLLARRATGGPAVIARTTGKTIATSGHFLPVEDVLGVVVRKVREKK